MRVVHAALVMQWHLSVRELQNIILVVAVPLLGAALAGIVLHAGRADLLPNALVAPTLVTTGHLSFFVASELIASERFSETLELTVAAPAPFTVLLLARVLVITGVGVFGFVETWLTIGLIAGSLVPIYHPLVLTATLLLATVAAASTAMITTGLFALRRQTRMFQNAVNYPLYVLSGVLVPVTILPVWLQPFSKVVFLYWAADLMRDAMRPEPVQDALLRMGAIVVLALLAGLLGATILRRMLDRQRQNGTLALT
jgi:ABC-2 type transport system permease protein